jgi:hypothetical protein
MFYSAIENLKSAQFKRLTGVKREVFEQMLEVLDEAKAKLKKHPSRGTPAKLSNADKLLFVIVNIATKHLLPIAMEQMDVVVIVFNSNYCGECLKRYKCANRHCGPAP